MTVRTHLLMVYVPAFFIISTMLLWRDTPDVVIDEQQSTVSSAELEQLQLQLESMRLELQNTKLSSDSVVSALSEELRDLQKTVLDLEELTANNQSRESPGNIEDTDNGGEEAQIGQTPHEQIDEQKSLEKQHFANLENNYRMEAVDRDWSSLVTKRLEAVFTNDSGLQGVSLSELDCRATQCRMEIWISENEANLGEVEDALGFSNVDETPRMAIQYVEGVGGYKKAIVYLSRNQR